MKHKMAEDQDKKMVARNILIKAGVAEECKNLHEEFYLIDEDSSAASDLMEQLIAGNDPSVEVFMGNRQEAIDLLEATFDETPDEGCSQCAKILDPDN